MALVFVVQVSTSHAEAGSTPVGSTRGTSVYGLYRDLCAVGDDDFSKNPPVAPSAIPIESDR